MRLRDYFFGIPITIDSPLPPDEVALRIGAASGFSFLPFDTGVVGGTLFGYLQLKYRRSIFGFDLMPRLSGEIVKANWGSRIFAKFGAPLQLKISIPFVFTLMFIMWFKASNGEPGLINAKMMLALIAMTTIMMIFGYFASTAQWREDLKAITDFLEEEIDARPAQ